MHSELEIRQYWDQILRYHLVLKFSHHSVDLELGLHLLFSCLILYYFPILKCLTNLVCQNPQLQLVEVLNQLVLMKADS